ncbi:hypothetical protein PENTCL1PPCAC_25974 [Pristionchus entomophagus]|uniref:Uncharacterized protein n=1 Tax=Pristionchus entomophagus TaxID=358040 RepID=A0AAV5UA86_9BILA|nr:hypothetical protein PENTCL1PPCAC_25974 [Pristionchus entomophagus]
MVTTRRSVSARSPPVNESPTQRVYPVLSDAEESSNEDEEDDHEESSTTHPDPPKLNTSSDSSFNSSSSSFNSSNLRGEDFNFLYGFLGLVIVCLVYWLLAGRSPHPDQTRSAYGKLVGTVLKAYPTITDHDRAQLGSAASRWFDNTTADPVVVIIYAAETSAALLDDLTTSTASFLGKKTTVVTSTPTTARSDLHSTFDNTLRGGSKSTIGMRQIEKLSWDTPLVLHAFADADHVRPDADAPSRPLIWLQVTRDDSLKGSLSCDAAIERTLTSSWLASGGTVDNVAPVISRVLQFTVCLDW